MGHLAWKEARPTREIDQTELATMVGTNPLDAPETPSILPLMDKFTGTLRTGVVLLAFASSAWAANTGPDPRTAKVWDESDTQSQVSGLTVTNTDLRFGFDPSDVRGRILVAAENIEWAVPLGSVSSIVRSGNATWTVKYQAKDGEATAIGKLGAALLAGKSDFGAFA